MNLRQITIKDQLELKKVYFDSIQSLDKNLRSLQYCIFHIFSINTVRK